MIPRIYMDGRLLVGGEWVRPSHWQEADLAAGLLPGLKGATPEVLPSLGGSEDDISQEIPRAIPPG